MEQLPLKMSLIKANRIAPQMNDSINIFLLLNGTLTITTAGKKYQLKKDDLLLVNPFQEYQIDASENSLFLYLRIYKGQIIHYFNDCLVPYFECTAENQVQKGILKFQKLREILAHLMVAYFKQNESLKLEIYQYLFTLLTHLVKEFQKEVVGFPQINISTADDRMLAILEKIQNEYKQVISLEQLAEENELSYYHLSRSFKKQVNCTFTEYLNQIRLIHATEELILTNHSVMKVALNNGFTNAQNFHQVFKKHYGITPAVYRKERSLINKQVQKGCAVSDYQEITGMVALQELAKYLVENDIEDENARIEQNLVLSVAEKWPRQTFQQGLKIIKIGPANEGLASNVQKELTILQQELAFNFVQFEGFCEETNVEDDINMISEYILNNQWLDFLMRIHLRPMIQLKLPNGLTSQEDVKRWCDKQIKMLHHFLNRYGMEEVSCWALQWLPAAESRFWESEDRLGYNYFYRKLKQLIPACKLGLSGLTSLDEEEYRQYKELLCEQLLQHTLPDFLSFQADPYATSSTKAEHALRFKEYQQEILTRVKFVIKKIQEEPTHSLWQPAIYLTDWNTLVGEGNTLAGTFFRSALILESILELSEAVTGIAYWLNIKVKERQTYQREDSSLSVFLYDDLKRPLFFTLLFLNRLKGELVSRGAGYVLTQNNGQYNLLIYNSSYFDPRYSVDTFQVQYQTKKIAVHLKGLPIGTYLIRQYSLDKDHGGIYNDWIRVGGQSEIDSELQNYLNQKILPKFELKKKYVGAQGNHFEATLTLNACQLYLFQPLY